MTAYADTSFFVALYLTDSHSPEAERRMVAGTHLWLTPLHVAEWTHAIEQNVFWNRISRFEADLLYKRFREQRESGIWEEAALSDPVFVLCADLGRRYAARFGLRTLDTLHVASALELKAEHFWTFDERQRKLARAAGLRTS